ncbi:unnamed protein product [Caenorhabditis auriculariae]|uniref:BHLH domain-containing protein n=1 Tax=Caenorhabditis auriculariae TaxID=2777116 RepID=A0A8S1HR85_9PELO|nr:unnamed protein product [Caenorhabditis auriculariae]
MAINGGDVALNPPRRTLPPRRRLISAPAARWSPPEDRKFNGIGHGGPLVRRASAKTPSPPIAKIIGVRKAPVKKTYVLAKQQRHSPPSDGSDQLHRFGDSPRSGSYQNEMLDDLIIDEILSLEDEQRRNGRPMSVGFSDNQPTGPMSMARPIPGSSGGSGHSGSPITIGNSLGNNFRQVVSSSAPTSSIDIEQMMSQDGDDYYRDRRKKDIHNMIERRRRYNINDRIKELGQMLPKASAEDMKLNKGTILKASCDYIRLLQKDRETMLRQQQHTKSLENTAKQYADRVKELEDMLSRQGIQLPQAHLPPLPRMTDRPIKQELDDQSPTNQTPSGSFSSGFLSEVTNNTAAMQITSPHGPRSFLNSAGSDSYFSVGSNSPPEYTQNNWKLPHQNFPDLMMEDINTMQGTPLLNGGDPLISAAGAHPSPHLVASQMSPDIQWDGAGFSPDAGQTSSNIHHHMEYS